MKASANSRAVGLARLKLAVRGAVQGVGFRPFVYRLAKELGLCGWVNNSSAGVLIEVEGGHALLEHFLLRLPAESPPRSGIQSLESSWLDPVGYRDFEIRASVADGRKTTLVLPDIATCPDCLREILDLKNRRFRYPFTNCTNCGPRFSIIGSLPYDRANTSMKSFPLCPACRSEYDAPNDRRFHAQPNACPACGPRLECWNAAGETIFAGHAALPAAAQAIGRGQSVAVKGIGGFHIMVDARADEAIRRLRERKQREEKPFALLFPSLASVKDVCEVSSLEERLLRSPEAPIVLLRRRSTVNSQLSTLLAPGNPYLGVMLPSNPLHHLLMAELGFPVVATSGNVSDEPICTDEHDALKRLRDIADVFLVHNRPIVRPVDDSIVRVMLGREMVVRRARGYAPLPIQIKNSKLKIQNVLAVGAHLKNSIALAVDDQVFISQHIGDLETEPANAAFRRVIGDFEKLYDAKPEIIAADLHPDYLSTQFAHEQVRSSGFSRSAPLEGGTRNAEPRVIGVQHHVAHVFSCIAENEVALPALGVSWDGTGYGTDGTIWGGEFFLVRDESVERVAHLRPFRLPGGGKAVKQPRRVALGLLYEMYGEATFEMNHLPPLRETPAVEMMTLKGMLQRSFNSPATSSAGRLFDAVASLIHLRQQVRFEGQAAMELEFARDGIETEESYHLSLVPQNSSLILDWAPMIGAILADVQRGESAGMIAAKFHNALAGAIVSVAKKFGEPRVVLSGGCFQNRYLTERTVTRLRAENFQPYWQQRVPTNDGGIALGQVFAARHGLQLRK